MAQSALVFLDVDSLFLLPGPTLRQTPPHPTHLRRFKAMAPANSKQLFSVALFGQNVNYRDKFLKIFQYSSRFLMGYYGQDLTPQGQEQLRLSVYNVLLVRRAARYIWFVVFMRGAVTKLQALASSKESLDLSPAAGVHLAGYDGALVASVEALEQIVWSVFFFLDTVILGARIGAIAYPEEDLLKMMEAIYFPLWFTGDATVFTKSALRLYRNACRRAVLAGEAGAAAALGAAVDARAGPTPPFSTPVSSPVRADPTAMSPFQRRLQANSPGRPDTAIDVEPPNGHSHSPSASRSLVTQRSPVGNGHAHAGTGGRLLDSTVAASTCTVAEQVRPTNTTLLVLAFV